MKIWSRIATWGLLGLAALNIAGAASYQVLQYRIAQAKPQPELDLGGMFPAFSGVDLQGASYEAQDVPCRVIRITDDRCPFCKKDRPSYEKFVDAARRASCEIVEIAPQANGMAANPRPGVVQLKFATADIGAALFPFATPQTVILDGTWSVKMTRRGIFSEESLASSIALLESLSGSQAKRMDGPDLP